MSKSLPVSFAMVCAVMLLVTPRRAGAMQLEYGGVPISEYVVLRRSVPTVRMARVEVADLLAEDASMAKGEALRFGAALDVELGPTNAGVWDELPGGDRVWRLRLASEGACSLSLVFSRFQLPRGAVLFVYDDRREVVRGAYTYKNHHGNGGLPPRSADHRKDLLARHRVRGRAANRHEQLAVGRGHALRGRVVPTAAPARKHARW